MSTFGLIFACTAASQVVELANAAAQLHQAEAAFTALAATHKLPLGAAKKGSGKKR